MRHDHLLLDFVALEALALHVLGRAKNHVCLGRQLLPVHLLRVGHVVPVALRHLVLAGLDVLVVDAPAASHDLVVCLHRVLVHAHGVHHLDRLVAHLV